MLTLFFVMDAGLAGVGSLDARVPDLPLFLSQSLVGVCAKGCLPQFTCTGLTPYFRALLLVWAWCPTPSH